MEILHIKLQRDLFKLGKDYCPDIDETWLTAQIAGYIETVDVKSISFDRHEKNTCSARLWDKGNGEKQCTHKKMKGDYCNKHRQMLDNEGVLRFGTITEPKPDYDLIKLQQGITEKLHWVHPDPYHQLQNVLDAQSRKVIYTTRKLTLN